MSVPATAADQIGGPAPLAYAAAALVGVFGFAFRFLALRGLPNDHYIYLSAAQQIVLGDVPGRDFVEPGMLLQFLISAAGQAIAPGPSTEAVLTAGLLALAAAVTCVGVSWLTRSTIAGALAGLFQILVFTRLYSFPKVLVPAVLLLLALAYARRPGTTQRALLAAWIAVAFLLRHDIGAYAAIAGACAVGLSHRTVGSGVRACAMLTATVLLVLAPYVIYLQWSGGIVEHVRGAFEYGNAESGGFNFPWPAIRFGPAARAAGAVPWSRDDSAAYLYYVACSLPLLSAVLLTTVAEHRRRALTRAGVGSAIVIALFYDVIILRHPVITRVQDLAAVYAILGAWTVVALLRMILGSRPAAVLSWRAIPTAAVVGAVAVAAFSVNVLAELPDELDEASLFNPPSALRDHAREVMAAGRDWPWRTFWPSGSPPDAVEYVNACTRPDERIWVTWPAPEWYVFTRRGFGAGHANTLSPHSYKTSADQQLVIARLDRNRVPIVLINESTRPEFAAAYPREDEYLRRLYVPSGQFTIRDGSTISIAIRRGLKATGTYGAEGWPCRFVADPAG